MLSPASSTSPKVPEYFLISTVVLSGKYWSTAKKVLGTLKVKNYRKLEKIVNIGNSDSLEYPIVEYNY